MFNSSSGRSHEHTELFFFFIYFFLFCSFVTGDSKCRNNPHHPPTSICVGVYFGFEKKYKIVSNIVKKNFFIETGKFIECTL